MSLLGDGVCHDLGMLGRSRLVAIAIGISQLWGKVKISRVLGPGLVSRIYYGVWGAMP
ncbi:hypothetical protein [Microcoleus sp. S13_C5]|uniref:hypothetical protein n=1 Tax=Microcoleus sp. S13_C5 TaxID=3055411 RepID=UPI002FCEC50C